MKWNNQPSCLDAAYEREAMRSGLVTNPVFPENKVNQMANSPSHYGDNKLMDLLIEKNVPFSEGNIMKYVFRWREKDGLKDLNKARIYLNALIAYAELEQATNTIGQTQE